MPPAELFWPGNVNNTKSGVNNWKTSPFCHDACMVGNPRNYHCCQWQLIVASQTLISGSFTPGEWGHSIQISGPARIVYPTIFAVNRMYLLPTGFFLPYCIQIVLYFRESGSMEAPTDWQLSLAMIKYHIAAGILSLHAELLCGW